MDGGNGATTTDYLISRAFVEQLDKSDPMLFRYEFFNMFPLSIGSIELSHETVDALNSLMLNSHSHTGKELSNPTSLNRIPSLEGYK